MVGQSMTITVAYNFRIDAVSNRIPVLRFLRRRYGLGFTDAVTLMNSGQEFYATIDEMEEIRAEIGGAAVLVVTPIEEECPESPSGNAGDAEFSAAYEDAVAWANGLCPADRKRLDILLGSTHPPVVRG